MSAETSVAMLQRGCASSTTTTRPVSDAVSRIVSLSSGDVVRGSTTVQLTPALGQVVSRLVGEVHHSPEGDNGRIVALAGDVRLAEGNGVGLVRHLDLLVVHGLVLEEDHRIVVADRLDQQALGLIGARTAVTHLQARDMGEDRIEALAVLGGGAEAGAVSWCGSPWA